MVGDVNFGLLQKNQPHFSQTRPTLSGTGEQFSSKIFKIIVMVAFKNNFCFKIY